MAIPRLLELSNGDTIDLNHVVLVGEIEDSGYNSRDEEDNIISITHKFLFQYLLSTGRSYSIVHEHHQTIAHEPEYDPLTLKNSAIGERKSFIQEWRGI